jgi:hypothetical protein
MSPVGFTAFTTPALKNPALAAYDETNLSQLASDGTGILVAEIKLYGVPDLDLQHHPTS